MRDVIYVKLDIVYSINHQLNETISRTSYFFETVKSKVIISLFETVRLSVLISPRNLHNSLKNIKEKTDLFPVQCISCKIHGTQLCLLHVLDILCVCVWWGLGVGKRVFRT